MFWKKKIQFNSGAQIDDRCEQEKALDYRQSEVVASVGQVIWIKKDKYRTFPTRKQDGSGSCVIQSVEKERGIIAEQKYGEFVIFSANPGYQKRVTPEIPGSTIEDSINCTNAGSIPEELSPSQSLNDIKMMKAKVPAYADDAGKIFGAKRIFLDSYNDIEAIASTIENTGKGVGLTIRFGQGEWFGNYEVKTIFAVNWTMGHRVCVVDYTLNDKGEKCLVIEDSACEDGYPQRLVPESFLIQQGRSYWRPSYILNFKTYEEIGVVPDKPVFDGSIISAQKCFAYEGFFPANTDFIENWGPITRKACVAFQIKYNIVPALGNFGPITKAKLIELYM
jgi:hypothetical protein